MILKICERQKILFRISLTEGAVVFCPNVVRAGTGACPYRLEQRNNSNKSTVQHFLNHFDKIHDEQVKLISKDCEQEQAEVGGDNRSGKFYGKSLINDIIFDALFCLMRVIAVIALRPQVRPQVGIWPERSGG